MTLEKIKDMAIELKRGTAERSKEKETLPQ